MFGCQRWVNIQPTIRVTWEKAAHQEQIMEENRPVQGQLPGSFSVLASETFCYFLEFLPGKSNLNI
jgi:hypothetical protein